MIANIGMAKLLTFIGFLVTHSSYTDAKALNAEQLFCVATAVYSEAQGEPLDGKAAIAWGIKHRTESKDFPKQPCDVVYQVKPSIQFPDIKRVKPDYESQAWQDAVEVSVLVWIGFVEDPIKGARFWYNPKKTEKPSWTQVKLAAVIGGHNFWDKVER